MAGFLIRARALARERKIEEPVDVPLNEFMCPKYFDLVAEAALLSSGENDDFLEPKLLLFLIIQLPIPPPGLEV